MTNPKDVTTTVPKNELLTLLHYVTERANNEMNYEVPEYISPDDALNAVSDIYSCEGFTLKELLPSEWQTVELDGVENSQLDPEVNKNQLIFAAKDGTTFVFVYDLGPIFGVEVLGRGIGTGLMRCESEETMRTMLQVVTRVV